MLHTGFCRDCTGDAAVSTVELNECTPSLYCALSNAHGHRAAVHKYGYGFRLRPLNEQTRGDDGEENLPETANPERNQAQTCSHPGDAG